MQKLKLSVIIRSLSFAKQANNSRMLTSDSITLRKPVCFRPLDSADLPGCSAAPQCESGVLQITTELMHGGLPVINGEYKGLAKKPAMRNMKRCFHDRGKDEIRQNVKAKLRKRLRSESSLGVPISVLD